MIVVSPAQSSQLEFPPEVERKMTPAARDFFERMTAFWQARVTECEARIAEQVREVKRHFAHRSGEQSHCSTLQKR